jgi:hypothetical protein
MVPSKCENIDICEKGEISAGLGGCGGVGLGERVRVSVETVGVFGQFWRDQLNQIVKSNGYK